MDQDKPPFHRLCVRADERHVCVSVGVLVVGWVANERNLRARRPRLSTAGLEASALASISYCMKLRQKLRLVPLAGLVAFPGHDVLLSTTITADKIADGATIGLIHRDRDGQLARVGSLATASTVSADADCCVLSCRTTSRFRVLEHDGTCATAFEPHEDTPADDAEAEARQCDAVRQRLRDLAALQARADGLPPADSASCDNDGSGNLSPAAFSLALAGRVEHESLADAQALLESCSTAERLATLDAALTEAAAFTSTMLSLQSLGLGG